MVDIWSWICDLVESNQWTKSGSHQSILVLASSTTTTRTIELRADHTSNPEAFTFTLCAHGFHSSSANKTLWVSKACNISLEKPFLPLIVQLLEEIIARSPTTYNTTCPRSKLKELKPDPISWIMDTHLPESFSSFFNLLILVQLFWLCVFDAPSEIGSFYFEGILGPNLDVLSRNHAPMVRTFLVTVGVDVELCLMRALGYILVKWLILRQVGVGLQALTSLSVQPLGFSYATESHGLWILKGYSPVLAMKSIHSNEVTKLAVLQPNESVLKYALAHQQLEIVIQFEYSVSFHDGYIQVNAYIDNIRINVEKLGFCRNDDANEYFEERHFPSRVRVWVGPEVGANYIGGLSLGKTTTSYEKEVEMKKSIKASSGNSKFPKVKARARVTTRTRNKNWRWDQDAEGNAAVFDVVLNDAMKEDREVVASGGAAESSSRFNTGDKVLFTKKGSIVFGRDEFREGVTWRLSREMEGSVLKWRIGAQIWLTYFPNHVRSSYHETRFLELCDEVDLPLIIKTQCV